MKTRAVRIAGAGLAVMWLAACGAGPQTGGEACPEIALLEGFTLEVAADQVPENAPRAVEVEACQDGECRTEEVQLLPGSDTEDLGCDGDGANGACSATAVPNGTLRGMWPTDDFHAGQIDATVSGDGFGPFTAEVAGEDVTSGTGSCAQTVFQTTLRIEDGELRAS